MNYFSKTLLYKAKKAGRGGNVDKDVGKLLYNVATRLKAQIKAHQSLIVEYIAAKKITTEVQLNGRYMFIATL